MEKSSHKQLIAYQMRLLGIGENVTEGNAAAFRLKGEDSYII